MVVFSSHRGLAMTQESARPAFTDVLAAFMEHAAHHGQRNFQPYNNGLPSREWNELLWQMRQPVEDVMKALHGVIGEFVYDPKMGQRSLEFDKKEVGDLFFRRTINVGCRAMLTREEACEPSPLHDQFGPQFKRMYEIACGIKGFFDPRLTELQRVTR